MQAIQARGNLWARQYRVITAITVTDTTVVVIIHKLIGGNFQPYKIAINCGLLHREHYKSASGGDAIGFVSE